MTSESLKDKGSYNYRLSFIDQITTSKILNKVISYECGYYGRLDYVQKKKILDPVAQGGNNWHGK